MAVVGQMWEQLVDCICRPPRDEYEVADLLGGIRGDFLIGRTVCKREDFQLKNKRDKTLEVSRFVNTKSCQSTAALPTVIYCHCNSGSRRDSEEAVYRLLPEGIAVVALDFEGSGLSEGNWVTLGAREVEDVQVVIEHLRKNNLASTIGLWGRSMGAVTTLLCSQRDPSIAGIVCDSPFARLTELMQELVEEQNLPIPKYLTKLALSFMRRSVKKRANFDIADVAPIDRVEEAFVPALFGHADGDNFIYKHHSQRLHDQYSGEKNFISFEGDHNSIRPTFFYTSVVIFFHNVLHIQGGVSSSGVHFPAPDRAGSTPNLDVLRQGAGARSNAFSALNTETTPTAAQAGGSDSIFSPAMAFRDPTAQASSWWDGLDANESSASGDLDDEDDDDIVMQRVLQMSLREVQHWDQVAQGIPQQPAAKPQAPATTGPSRRAQQPLQADLMPDNDEEARMLVEAIAASLAETITREGGSMAAFESALAQQQPPVRSAEPAALDAASNVASLGGPDIPTGKGAADETEELVPRDLSVSGIEAFAAGIAQALAADDNPAAAMQRLNDSHEAHHAASAAGVHAEGTSADPTGVMSTGEGAADSDGNALVTPENDRAEEEAQPAAAGKPVDGDATVELSKEDELEQLRAEATKMAWPEANVADA